MHHFEQPARTRVVRHSVDHCGKGLTSPNCFQAFPVELVKKMGFARTVFFVKKTADWQFWHDPAGPLPTVSDCFRLFPTVSSPLEGQRRPWTIDSTKIATVNTLLHDPCAGRLLEMMHFDFKTQYTLRIPKFQDLVKFNRVGNWTCSRCDFMMSWIALNVVFTVFLKVR